MGCSFDRDRTAGTLKISQPAFVDSLVEKFDVSTLSSIPACPTVELRPKGEDEVELKQPFREVVGSLMWLANMTRPDITDAVRAVARFTNEPGNQHWKAARKILAYVAGTRDVGLIYRQGSGSRLSAYADSSFANKADDRKSVSGGAVLYGGAAVMWLSRTQRCVTLSSTEAEYVAIGECVKEVLFLRGVLKFIQPSAEVTGIPVYEDNQGAIKLTENPLSSARTRHIDIRHHFIRTLSADGDIRI